jgi:dienelactone hydrolase
MASNVQFDLVNNRVLFLKPNASVSNKMELFQIDVSTGVCSPLFKPSNDGDQEEHLSLAEKLRRERSRSTAVGLTSYTLLNNNQGVIFPLQGSIYWVGMNNLEEPVLLVDKASLYVESLVDIKASPNGRMVSFVAGSTLYLVVLPSDTSNVDQMRALCPLSPIPLHEKSDGVTFGIADYLSQEEFDRYFGYEWSPESDQVVFQFVDERHVPELTILHIGAEPASSVLEETHRFPFAGKANPKIGFFVVSVTLSASIDHSVPLPQCVISPPVELDLGIVPSNNLYVPRMLWSPASNARSSVLLQLLNREQNIMDVVQYNLATFEKGLVAQGTLLLRETAYSFNSWVSVCDALKFVSPSSFLWLSERSGFQHLYLYSMPTTVSSNPYTGIPSASDAISFASHTSVHGSANFQKALTTGADCIVEQICAVVDDVVVFSGAFGTQLEHHLYACSLSGSVEETNPLRLTSGAGMHSVKVAPNGTIFADSLSSLHASPSLSIFKLTSSTTSEVAGEEGAAKVPASTFSVGNERLETFLSKLVTFDQRGQYGGISRFSHESPAYLRALFKSVELVGVAHGVLPGSGSTPVDAYNTNLQNLSLILTEPVAESSSTPSAAAAGSLRDIVTSVGSKLMLALSPSASESSTPTASGSQQGAASPAVAPIAPLLLRLACADGVTPMYASLAVPDARIFGPGPYPLVVSVYGGPRVQYVKHDWSLASDARVQALRREGFLVARFDNRGSFRRGRTFELALNRAMGTVEVEDQAAGVAFLVASGLADPSRVGVYGWSYGGYMSLMCLAKRADVFRCAVSGAPVTDWEGYDTAYTERFMGTPEGNPDGYKEGSVLTHAGSIKGPLLLVVGAIDENVHARHSYRLINRLTQANVDYDLMLFPDERHLPRNPVSKAYMEKRVMAFFKTHLLKKTTK